MALSDRKSATLSHTPPPIGGESESDQGAEAMTNRVEHQDASTRDLDLATAETMRARAAADGMGAECSRSHYADLVVRACHLRSRQVDAS